MALNGMKDESEEIIWSVNKEGDCQNEYLYEVNNRVIESVWENFVGRVQEEPINKVGDVQGDFVQRCTDQMFTMRSDCT